MSQKSCCFQHTDLDNPRRFGHSTSGRLRRLTGQPSATGLLSIDRETLSGLAARTRRLGDYVTRAKTTWSFIRI